MFELMKTHPGIKGFCYIDWDWPYWSARYGFNWYKWGDAWIERWPELLARYRQELRDGPFVHARL